MNNFEKDSIHSSDEVGILEEVKKGESHEASYTMKVRDYIDQNNLDSGTLPILSSGRELHEKLGLDPFNFDYDQEKDILTTIVHPAKWLQSHEDVVHGGIIATYLDSVAGVHAMLHALPLGKKSFTKKITVEYSAPMRVNKSYVITSTTEEKAFIATIMDGDTLIAKAELVFAFI